MVGPDVEVGGQQPTTSTCGTERKCGLDKRRLHQLVALVLGVLEVGFSVSNAVVEDAFKVKDAQDFVFSASAVMESVGLGVLLLVALTPLCRKKTESAGEDSDFLEEFGSPLAILVNGITQENSHLTNAGFFGTVCQAATVCTMGLILLYKIARTAFIAILCAIILLFCCLTSVAHCCRFPIFEDEIRSPFDFSAPGFQVVGVTLVVLPLGVDVAEFFYLILGGESWRAVILAVLDVVVTVVFVISWGMNRFWQSAPEFCSEAGSCSACLCLYSCVVYPVVFFVDAQEFIRRIIPDT